MYFTENCKMNEHLFEAYRQRLRGMELTYAWKGYGSAYFLEFGDLKYGTFPSGRLRNFPSGQLGVNLSWGWRVEQGNRIICGGWSDDDIWPGVFKALLGAQVTDIVWFGRLPEIEIELSNGFRLLSFMPVEDGPEWAIRIRKPDGETASLLEWRDGTFIEVTY
jgi:hypothetical protein